MYLDIGTPGSVFEELNERIREHLGAFSGEFSGQFSAMNISSGDPMKIQLGVFFEYTHNGASRRHSEPISQRSGSRPCSKR